MTSLHRELVSIQQQEKPKRILEAARGLFSSLGLKNTSIEDIATKAGLGKGTVYLYFKSKEEIFSSLVADFQESLHFVTLDASSISGTATDKLNAIIEARVNWWERSYVEYGLTTISLYEALSTPVSKAARERFQVEDVKLIKEVLEEGIRSGEFAFANCTRNANLIHATLDALCFPWETSEGRVAAQDRIKTFCRLLLKGLNVH
ncbi:MAG: TetR/AcrR family transcriptional regulator [Proteobacteria bacterium]|nr:MAG: TetR/AcrR family transcriptional regulator [Pseudomonadota bacterium]